MKIQISQKQTGLALAALIVSALPILADSITEKNWESNEFTDTWQFYGNVNLEEFSSFADTLLDMPVSNLYEAEGFEGWTMYGEMTKGYNQPVVGRNPSAGSIPYFGINGWEGWAAADAIYMSPPLNWNRHSNGVGIGYQASSKGSFQYVIHLKDVHSGTYKYRLVMIFQNRDSSLLAEGTFGYEPDPDDVFLEGEVALDKGDRLVLGVDQPYLDLGNVLPPFDEKNVYPMIRVEEFQVSRKTGGR